MKKTVDRRKGKRLALIGVMLMSIVTLLTGTVFAVAVSDTFLNPQKAAHSASFEPAAVGAQAGAETGEGNYTVTVNTTFPGDVSGETQNIEFYQSGHTDAPTDSATLGDGGTKAFTCPADDTSPTLNLKSSSAVSITSVEIKDADDDVITVAAFGSQAQYDYFIESTKTSLYGYIELQDITGNITVNVTYGAPVDDLGKINSSTAYSITVVTKGETGPYHTFSGDKQYEAVGFNFNNNYSNCSGTSSFNNTLDTTHATGSGTSAFTFGSYKAVGQCCQFNPGDGTQMTRYSCGNSRRVDFDYTNYAYISDIKAYYNDDGTELTDSDLSALIGQKDKRSQYYSYNASANSYKSVTFVVTYSKNETRAIYTYLNSPRSTSESWIALTCPQGDPGKIFRSDSYDAVDEYTLSENSVPINTGSNTSNRVMVSGAEKIRYNLKADMQDRESLTLSNIHIYLLNIADHTAPTEITSYFDGKISCPITDNKASRTLYSDDMYAEIDLTGNTGDLYITMDVLYYNTAVNVRTSGAHTADLTVTAKDNMGRIGDYTYYYKGQLNEDTYDSFTLSADTTKISKWFYGGATYVLESTDPAHKLTGATFAYMIRSGNSSSNQTATFSADTNGRVEVTIPEILYNKRNSSSSDPPCKLTAVFDPIDTRKAQVRIAYNDAETSYNGKDFVRVSTVDGSDSPTTQMFMEDSSNGVSAYQSVTFKSTSYAPNNSAAYQIEKGATVKAEYIFDPANNGANYAGLSQDLKDFVDKRIEFIGFRIRKMSDSTAGDVIRETSDGVKTITFTMPSDTDIRIEPIFKDHVHMVSVIANDKNAADYNYLINNSSYCSSASLVPKVNTASTFINYFWRGEMSDSYHTASYTGDWTTSRFATVDGTQFTLTVLPKMLDATTPQYRVKSVKAYALTKNKTNSAATTYTSYPARNYSYYTSSGTITTSSYKWLGFNADGTVANDEIAGVVGELDRTAADGTVTCDITIPRTINDGTLGPVGNVVLYVEFEENADATVYAPFKYEINQLEGVSSFKPVTTVLNPNSEVEGISEATYTATNGMDKRVVYYDPNAQEADRRTVTLKVGGNGNVDSAFFYTNLVYTLTSYDGDTNYGSFRYFKDQWYAVDDTDLSTVIDISQNVKTDYSASTGACSEWTMTLKVPKQTGLKLTCTPQETYIPLTIYQYAVDADGNVSEADNSFTTSVTKFGAQTDDDRVKDKFFKDTFVEDYFANLNDAEGYSNSFTVTGASAQHNEALYKSSGTGFNLNPQSVPDGYVIAAVECKAYNRTGGTYSGYYSDDGGFYDPNRPLSITKTADGYKIKTSGGNVGYARSWRQEVKIYYAKTAKLTVTQHLDQVLSDNNTVSNVTIANNNGTLAASAMTPFINYGDTTPFENSVSHNIHKNNYTGIDGTAYTWSKEMDVNRGTVTKITVKPNDTHSISEVRIYTLDENDQEVPVAHHVTGTGAVGAETVYTLDSPIAVGEHIYVDITYAVETTLRVKAIMLNDTNSQVANDPDVTKATVNVTGVNVNADSTTDNTPFHNQGETERFGSFTVTDTESVLLNASAATRLTLQTSFSGESAYTVANVRMRTGTDLNSYNNWSWITGVQPQNSTDYEGNTVYNYDLCNVNGLTAGKNTEIDVYLVRTAPMTVSVYTYDTAGNVHEGVPNRQSGTGDDTGSYVNVGGSVNTVTSNAFITLINEGHYSTGDFRLTYGNNYSRDLNVIQGASLSVFAMLPDSGDYVIKEITGAGITAGVGSVSYTIDDSGTRFLKTTVSTDGTIYPNHPGGYEIKIYIAPAKSIITRSRTVTNSGSYTKPNGTVKMYADEVTGGVQPFTQVYPTVEEFTTAYYTASSTSTNTSTPDKSYTTETKTVAGTKLHFTVKADQNFMIDTVKAYLGDFGGQQIKLKHSAPASDGTVTYTMFNSDNTPFTMPELSNVYVDVTFATRDTGTVILDYQYTDDFTTWNDYFGDKGAGSISASNSNSAYQDVLKLTDANGVSENTFSIPSGNNHTYKVVTGSSVTVRASHLNGLWYMATEAWITDGSGAQVQTESPSGDTGISMTRTVHTDETLTFHVRFIPVARYCFRAIDNNIYFNSPEGVDVTDKTDRDCINFYASNTGKSDPVYTTYSSGGWANNARCEDGKIAKDSTIDSVTVNMRKLVYPGKLEKINIYEFNKGADINDLSKGTLIAQMADQHDQWTYNGNSIVTGMGSSGVGTNTYTPADAITVSDQKIYLFYAEYDVIDIYTHIYGNSASVRPYLVSASDKDTFNIDYIDNSSGSEFAVPVTLGFGDASFDCQISAGIRRIPGPLYYVIVSTEPREDLSITDAYFKDYKDKQSVRIIDELKKDENYRTVVNSSGAKRYYYIYEIKPIDEDYPVDNSMEFKIYLKRISNPSTPTIDPGEDNTSYVTVTQYDRVNYDDYTVSVDDTAVVSHSDGSKLKKVGNDNEYDSVQVPDAGLTSVQLISAKKKQLKLELTPRDGYNVEKIVISDSGKTTLYPKNADPADSDTYYYTIKGAAVSIDIYYARPILRVTATNKATKPNAVVSVIDDLGSETIVLKATDFTKDTQVTKGDNKTLKISPVTYQTEEGGVTVEKKYTVDYIAVGDASDNVLPIYDESKPDPNISPDYDVEKDSDGNYTLTISNIQKDVHVFIQLMGETRVLTSALEVRHHIWDVDLGEYADCSDDNVGGTVTTSGTLDGIDAPLTDSSGAECSSFVLGGTEPSVTGGALANTVLTFGVTDVPENFRVTKVTGKYGDNSTIYEAYLNSDGKYQFPFSAPDSGVLCVDVYYGLNLTEYTLNYQYESIKSNQSGSYTGDDLEKDTKTYTVTKQLTDSYIKDGKPLDSVLVENAPAITDLYKDCTWTIDDQQVAYDQENNTVTVTAVQTPRKYTVQFSYADHLEEPQVVRSVPLNDYAKDTDGSFITAPEKDDSDNDFACWVVTDADAPEYDEDGEMTGYKEIARCYDRQFNLRVTGNYLVTAYYEEVANALYISDPEFSRQQYTDDNGKQVDRLYADFVLAFMEKNGLLLNPKYENSSDDQGNDISGYQTGLILEYDPDIMLEKADAAGETLSDAEKEAAYALYTEDDVLTEEDAIDLVTDSAPSLSDGHRYVNYTIRNSSYNNKNRLDKSISFGNSSAIRHLVMRAYYYVYDPTSETIEMTAPVYFYLYDIGNSVPQTDDAAPQP